MREKFEELVDGFVNNRVGVAPSFIPQELIAALQKDLSEIHFNGLMSEAGVGNIASRVYAPEIRKDKIYWLDNKSKNINQQQFLDIVAQFVSYLNSTCYTGLNDYEFHFAVYEPGSFYKKHKDQFRNDTGRKFSFITYLNDNWTDGDGG
ncbi:MAG: 2OG-Fe(II) oxygenase, partial [Chitinophagales bacterium]|nr:2OG-Fe(II) oxygenase [Chitinophagales bacterium]